MRTISSRTCVGTLLPPTKWLPLLGAGNIPPYAPPAVKRSWALGSSSPFGIALLGKGEKIGCVLATFGFALIGLLEFALQVGEPLTTSGVLKVSPALVMAVCCAAETWYAQGTCNPEFGISTLFTSRLSDGRLLAKFPP